MKIDSMPLQTSRWTPFLTLVRREVHRFLKVWAQTVLTPLVSSSLYFLIFGVSLGKNIQLMGGVPYLSFLIPGLVVLGCFNNAFQNSSSSIATARFGGELEDFKVAPLTNQQLIWAFCIGGLIRGLTVATVTFVVGEAFHYLVLGELQSFAQFHFFILFLCIGGLSFAALGVTVAFWAKTFDQLSAVSGFILVPLLYLGGVFFSIESLHPFWQTVAKFNPLLYLTNGARYGLIGASDLNVWHCLIVGILALILTHALAYRTLKKASFARW